MVPVLPPPGASLCERGTPDSGIPGATMAPTTARAASLGTSADSSDPIAILLEASEAAAANSLDLDALLVELSKLVRKFVDYELYALLLPTEDGHLRIAHSVGFPDELVKSLRVPRGSGLTGRAAGTKSTVLVENVDLDPAYLRAVDSVRSELAVPLVARDQLVAVLDLQSADPHAFDSQVSDLLELVASRFSLAIEIARLYHAHEKQRSTLETLHEISQEYSNILRLDDLLEKVAGIVRTLIRYDVLALYLKDPQLPLLRHYFGVKFQEQVRWRDIPVGDGLVGAAAASGQPLLVPDTSKDARYIESLEGIRSEVAVPLMLKGEVTGVLDLESVTPAGFSKDDLDTLMLLAPQVAATIENARLYEEKARNEARLAGDLAAARALQGHLLPDGHLCAGGLEIAARNDPAAVVSGDFYDFYQRDGMIGILNGDVSGKGAAAALYAALASGLLRSAARSDLSPGETLRRANEALLDREVGTTFLAAMYAKWSSGERVLELSGAGLPFPYVYRQGHLARVELAGIPLGLFRDAEYEDVRLALQPGDLVVSVSDGFTESFDEDGEAYGEQRLQLILDANRDETAATILDRVFADVGLFSAGAAQPDDRTAVVLRVIR